MDPSAVQNGLNSLDSGKKTFNTYIWSCLMIIMHGSPLIVFLTEVILVCMFAKKWGIHEEVSLMILKSFYK